MKFKELRSLQADDVLINKKNGNILIFAMFTKPRNIILEHLLGEKMLTYQYHDFNYLADLDFYTPDKGRLYLQDLIERLKDDHLIYYSEEYIKTEHYKDYIRTLLGIKNTLFNQYSLNFEIKEDAISITRACINPTTKK